VSDAEWRDLVVVAAKEAGAHASTIEQIARLLDNDDQIDTRAA
jgi:hypothetical protein